MKLYISPGACSMAPHMILIELGLPHTAELVDIRSQPHVVKSSGVPYSTVSKKEAVPALELSNGEVLTENGVILQYLADQKPEAGLLPKMGSMERYRAMEWLSFVASDVHKTFGPLWNPNMPDVGKAVLKQTIDRRFKFLDQHFATNSYLMGETFTVADAYLWVIVGWTTPLKIDLSPYPNLKRFHERVGARPAAAKMLKAEGLI